jgi:hypothetical protein
VKASVGWRDMAEIPPILVVRMTLVTPAGDRSAGD